MKPAGQHRRRVESTPSDSGRMWPLDVSALALGGLVLFLIVGQFRFDDPRPLYNAKTYLLAVPCISLALALVLRRLTGRVLRKSIQLGFLFSVSLHLLLLILAVNLVVFAAYQPTASKGKRRERTPIRKTVPEHVFQVPKQTRERPDWSKPVDAQTAARAIPKEQAQLPPVERAQPRLEVPKPRSPEIQPMQKFLLERQQPETAPPMPSTRPSKLARRKSSQPVVKPSRQAIDVPAAPQSVSGPVTATPRERPLNETVAASSASRPPARLKTPDPRPLSPPVERPTPVLPAAASRSPSQAVPQVGEAGLARARRSRRIGQPAAVAGAAPVPLSVPVAREQSDAALKLSPMEVPAERGGPATGAQITRRQTASPISPSDPPDPTSGSPLVRDRLMAMAGAPQVRAGTARAAAGRARRMNTARGALPLGASDPAASLPGDAGGGSAAGTADVPKDRLGMLDRSMERGSPRRGPSAPQPRPAGSPALELDLSVDPGPAGIGPAPVPEPGMLPAQSQPEVAAIELPRPEKPRRRAGGPAAPAGTKIAAVESFSRRVMRTSGGAASNAPGMGGPATEEAIERGLAYLASVQNADGSWSLQGHGEPVLLQSDTAATGLCLLAFQGAGYTHKQHQYAEAVGRGLKFLLDHQRTSGNLYRPENPASDRNVMFYSHGIAALALCEAYGMTQDRDLRQAAQRSLDYIMATQHRSRGGWRYTPQVSSDTSVTGWMMMALKSGDLAGLRVTQEVYDGIDDWLGVAQGGSQARDRYRYNPFAPDTPQQRHGRRPTPTMTAVGMLMRMYNGWQRDHPAMQSAADYLLKSPPQLGDQRRPRRDGYYWYYATQFMFHMGGDYWERWNQFLNPLLLETQIKTGDQAGSWDPENPVRDRWAVHAGRLYVTTMNLLNLEVYYRHLPIYEDTAAE